MSKMGIIETAIDDIVTEPVATAVMTVNAMREEI